jgi:hypothetical protein
MRVVIVQKLGFTYVISDITCPVFTITAVTTSMSAPNHAEIVCNNLAIQCSLAYSYKEDSWPHIGGHGTVDIDIANTYGEVTVALLKQNMNVQLQSVSSQLKLGSFHLSFHGNSLDWLIDLFKPLIQDIITKVVDSKFPEVMNTVVTEANALLLKVR